MHACVGMVSLASWRHCGIAPMSGALNWKILDFGEKRVWRRGGVLAVCVSERVESTEVFVG